MANNLIRQTWPFLSRAIVFFLLLAPFQGIQAGLNLYLECIGADLLGLAAPLDKVRRYQAIPAFRIQENNGRFRLCKLAQSQPCKVAWGGEGVYSTRPAQVAEGQGRLGFCHWETWEGGHQSQPLVTLYCQAEYCRVVIKRSWHWKKKIVPVTSCHHWCFSEQQRQWDLFLAKNVRCF